MNLFILKLGNNKMLRGIVAKLIAGTIKRKLGCKIDIQLDELEIQTVGDKIILRTKLEAKVNEKDFENLLKGIDLDEE